jgi:hypothetical protein
MKLSKGEASSQHVIPASGLPAGTYFVKVQMGGQSLVRKMVKL